MTPVAMGEDAKFTAGMKVIATGDVFNGLDEESFKIHCYRVWDWNEY